MKQYGKVTDFNGFNGFIKGIDGKDYLIMNHELLSNDIVLNDLVYFEPDIYESTELKQDIARFIRPIRKEYTNGDKNEIKRMS